MTDLPATSQINQPAQPATGSLYQSQNPSLPVPPVKPPAAPPGATPGRGMAKEIDGGISASLGEIVKPVEVAHNADLPKEVISAGVKQSPQVFAVPQNLKEHGVKPAGDNVTLCDGSEVVLPLTDKEIAEGLKQSISDSVRWLAEWCKRRLDQLHKSLTGRK